MSTLVLTLDIDTPTEYAALHGLNLVAEDPHLMYRRPLDRFAELCEHVGGPGTMFCITRDVCGVAAQKVSQLCEAGFEVASHSHEHDYGLTLRSAGAVLKEIKQTKKALKDEIGIVPLGFRAPGYHLSTDLVYELDARGFMYDSSVMPSPPYYAAKAAVMAAYRIARKPTAAVLGKPGLAFAPRTPYRPGRDPYAPGDKRIVELPIAVATPAGLPVTGASWVLAPKPLRGIMQRSLGKQEHLVLNLHAMDLVDPDSDALPNEIRNRQPELRMGISDRMALFARVFGELAQGRDVLTCLELAKRCGARAPKAKQDLKVVSQ